MSRIDIRSGPRRFGALFMLLVVVPVAACDDNGFGPDVTISEPFDFQLDAAGSTNFTLIGVNGEIGVVGVTGSNVFRATGFRRVRDCRSSLAEDLIHDLTVSVTENGETISVQTSQPPGTSPCNLVVDYLITAPARLVVQITSVNGEITISDLSQGVSVTHVNGQIELDDVEHGAEVRLTNGQIIADLEIAGDETIDLLTINGSIDLVIPTGTNALLSASLVNGTIAVSDLDLSDQVVTQTSVTGRLGDGDGLVVLRTTNGTIVVRGS